MGMVATRRDRMMETGGELFLRRGYAAVGLRELLEAVGSSKGAFYHFFPTKEAFAVAVLESHLARRLAEMDARFPEAVSLADILGWLKDDWAAQQTADYVPRCLIRRLAADVGAGVPLENTGVALHALATRLAEAVSSGQRAGHLYAQLDPMAAAWHVLDLWHGATERARLERGDGAPKAALAHLEAWLKP